ncbi:hypothetical protein ABTK02_20050, partial [Acinetobacter baumannii]
KKLATDNPEAARGVVRAFNRGLVDTLRDLDAAIEAVARREPLINKAVETERRSATLHDERAPPPLATAGRGAPAPPRLARSIGIVREANGLARAP